MIRTSVFAAALSACCLSHADVITISDTTFLDSDWSVHESTFNVAGSTSSATQAVGSGYTGNARLAGNAVVGGGGGIYGINILQAQSWNGWTAIEDLSFSIRARRDNGLQAFGFAVEQGGKRWLAGYFLNTFTYDLYTVAVTSADFVLPYGVDPTSQAEHPDFSAGAAPIRFGFYIANSSTMWGYSTSGYYSDFSVSFVPAPGVAGAIAAAMVGMVRRRRGR